ncbi:MAG: cytochrome-c peroxidase [Gemmatimonadales bacterium]
MPRVSRVRLLSSLCVFAGVAVAGCDSTRSLDPRSASGNAALDRNGGGGKHDDSLAALVRGLAKMHGITPLVHPAPVRQALVRLGQALAFDKILSGTRDISCMTCHHPDLATGDGRSLSIGQGGVGLGPNRVTGTGAFIARNAPPLFNLFAQDKLFLDGRVSVDANGVFHTPAGSQLTPAMTRVFEFGAVSALGMFPVTSPAEMRGTSGNELASIAPDDFTDIWAGIMKRLGEIPEYRRMFEEAYPGKKFDDMNFAYASNAIAGFFVDQLSFTGTPWDRFLAGDDRALSDRQMAGAQQFLSLKCSVCHTGPTLSDRQFHDVAVAQIGPGEGNGPSGRDDFGRFNVTNDPADLYRFRTSPLRNVELTGPYGHDGSIVDLRAFIEHYSESDKALLAYNPFQLEPLLRGTLLNTSSAILAQRDTLLNGVVVPPAIVDQLTDYMSALTDDAARDLHKLVPHKVPSGLVVDR